MWSPVPRKVEENMPLFTGVDRGILFHVTVLVIAFAIFLILSFSLGSLTTGAISLSNLLLDGEEYESFEDESELAETAGFIAWTLGLILNSIFIAIRRLKGILHIPPKALRYVHDIHSYSNITLAAIAFYHGYSLRSSAGLIEYLIAVLILTLIGSGIILRYSYNKTLKRGTRLIHSQQLLTLILLVLLIIHVTISED